jgi:hypothetical protein
VFFGKDKKVLATKGDPKPVSRQFWYIDYFFLINSVIYRCHETLRMMRAQTKDMFKLRFIFMFIFFK